MTSKDNLQQTSTQKEKWLFPMTLHPVFDDVFKTWAGSLRETCGRGEALIPAISCAVGTTCFQALSSVPHSVWTSKVWKHALGCFHESDVSGWDPIPMGTAYGFAHKVHAACVTEYKLTKDKQVIEENIQKAIQETGDRETYIKFECSGFIPSLVGLLYEDRWKGTGQHQKFKKSIVWLLHKVQLTVVREKIDSQFFETTNKILNEAPFIKNKADTMTVEEARDFAGKVHQAFVLALTPA